MRIVVDYDLCESNAICMAMPPTCSRCGTYDLLHVLNEAPGEDRREKMEEAVQRCPKQAIAIED